MERDKERDYINIKNVFCQPGHKLVPSSSFGLTRTLHIYATVIPTVWLGGERERKLSTSSPLELDRVPQSGINP